MMGKHHILVNTGMLVSGVGLLGVLLPNEHQCLQFSMYYETAPVGFLSDIIYRFLEPLIQVHAIYLDSPEKLSMWMFLGYLCFCFGAFLFGTLLPDIDNRRSILGRYLYLPLKHRTWTHTIWFCLLWWLLDLLSWVLSLYTGNVLWVWIRCIVRWIGVGYVLHVWMDTYSAQGVCWFYPFQKYKEYASGAVVKPKHKCKLYYTNKPSEKWMVFFVLLLCGLSIWFFGYCFHGYANIWDVLRLYLF